MGLSSARFLRPSRLLTRPTWAGPIRCVDCNSTTRASATKVAATASTAIIFFSLSRCFSGVADGELDPPVALAVLVRVVGGDGPGGPVAGGVQLCSGHAVAGEPVRDRRRPLLRQRAVVLHAADGIRVAVDLHLRPGVL